MELGSSRLIVTVIISLWVLEVVFCFDQLHLYQDEIKDKLKLPIEVTENYAHYIRHRRDVNSSQPLGMRNDSHIYYNSHFSRNGNAKYWNELTQNPAATKDKYLSNGALRSKNVQLKFKFPYYGHPITNVSITTGGFLYVGYVETSLKMKVMYIAPLMAFFNTSLNDSSAIYHLSTDSQFTVQWNLIHLQNAPKLGPFTFQCTLYKDGRIVFAYKALPVKASQIPKTPEHHVKIGVSDAFIGYRWWRLNGRLYKVRIFYIYHAVSYKLDDINSMASLLLVPLPNCVIANNCTECINLSGKTEFSCSWCSNIKRCSDGLDRHRVEWFTKSCDKLSIDKYDQCSIADWSRRVYSSSSSNDISGMKVGGIIAIVLFLIVIIGIGVWCFYAYTHPVSRSGLFLIDLRRKPGELFRRANAAASSSTTTGATTGTSTA